MNWQEKSQSRNGALAAVLVVALAAVGCASRWATPFEPSAHMTVIVAANDAVVPDPIALSKSKRHEADWYSWPGSTLTVQFDDSSLFPRLTCSGNHCSSGPISGKAATKAHGYHARVSSPAQPEQKASIDPTVMIDP